MPAARRTPCPTRTRRLLQLLAVPVIVAACAEPVAPPEATPSGSGPSPLLATSTVEEYTWGQGQVPTPMGSTIGRVCFLTFVAGDFRWASEYLRIYSSNGTWYLYGGSLQTGVKGRARCVTVTGYSNEYAITAPAGVDTSLGMSGIACGVTRMGGQFKSRNDRFSISQGVSNPTHWSLQLRSEVQSGYVHVRARCITSNAFLVGSDSWTNHYPAVQLTTDSGAFCFLTGVSGDLNASTYWVRVFKSSSGWYLEGSSQKNWGGAKGTCVKPYVFGTVP